MLAPPAVDEGTFLEWVRPSLLAMTWLAARLGPEDDVDDVVQDRLRVSSGDTTLTYQRVG